MNTISKGVIVATIVFLMVMISTFLTMPLTTVTTVPTVTATDPLPPGAVVMYPGDRLGNYPTILFYSGMLCAPYPQPVFTIHSYSGGQIITSILFPTLKHTFKVWDSTYALLAVEKECVTVIKVS